MALKAKMCGGGIGNADTVRDRRRETSMRNGASSVSQYVVQIHVRTTYAVIRCMSLGLRRWDFMRNGNRIMPVYRNGNEAHKSRRLSGWVAVQVRVLLLAPKVVSWSMHRDPPEKNISSKGRSQNAARRKPLCRNSAGYAWIISSKVELPAHNRLGQVRFLDDPPRQSFPVPFHAIPQKRQWILVRRLGRGKYVAVAQLEEQPLVWWCRFESGHAVISAQDAERAMRKPLRRWQIRWVYDSKCYIQENPRSGVTACIHLSGNVRWRNRHLIGGKAAGLAAIVDAYKVRPYWCLRQSCD